MLQQMLNFILVLQNTKHILLTILVIVYTTMALLAHENKSDKYRFVENKGQWPDKVNFRAATTHGNLYLEKNSITYQLWDYSELINAHANVSSSSYNTEKLSFKQHVFSVNFLNANQNFKIQKNDLFNDYYNFYLGNNPKHWAGNVKAYAEVQYAGLYNKIDFHFYSKEKKLKYDFVIHPGGNPSDINLLYKNADTVFIKNGKLHIKTIVTEIVEQEPYAYQIIKGKEVKIKCGYKLEKNILSFNLPDGYDKNYDLIIDPVLIFSSFSGSNANNFGMTATYDNSGNFYAGGIAYDNGYPVTSGAFSGTFSGTPSSGNTDVVITKYNPQGTGLIYSTYIGGTGTETVHSLVVNSSDELYLFGTTGSLNFPVTANAYDTSFNGGVAINFIPNGTLFNNGTDLYVAKFNSAGSALLGSTYIGGSANDGINHKEIIANNANDYDSLMANYGDNFRGEIMIDKNGDCYIASCTRSADFPVVNGFQNTYAGKQDGVVFKFNSNLSALLWSTYIGGTDKDAAYSVKIDSAGNAYVAGGTISTDFPTTSSVISQTYQGGKTDGFVIKINPTGNSLLKSTYIGTSAYDQCYFLEIDRNEFIYILGQSTGAYPIINANYSNPNSGQFVSKLQNDLSAYIYSTRIGNGNGLAGLSPAAFLVDKCENIYVSGWGGNIITGPALNNMPVTSDAIYPNPPNGFDFYLMVLERDVKSLLYGSYFGGNISSEHVDGGTSRFDKNGIVYQSVCAGCQNNDDFPSTPGAWSATNNSMGCNNGVFKFDFQISPKADFSVNNIQGCAPLTVQFTNNSTKFTTFKWDFGNGDTTSFVLNPTRTYTDTGTYYAYLTITDTICGVTDTALKIITIYPAITANAGPDKIICTGTSGIIGTTPQSGFTYTWTPTAGLNNPNSATPTVTVNNQTQYILNITQQSTGCNASDTVLVSVDSVSAAINSIQKTGCNICTGEAEVAASTGIPPFTFLWNDSSAQTTPTATGLCGAAYTVTVTDSIGCKKTLSVSIPDSTDLLISNGTITSINCFGECNGSANVNATGGNTPYSFIWNDPLQQTGNTVTGLCAGTYMVKLTDNSNCKDSVFVAITQPSELLINSASSANISCNGDCNANAGISVSGGTSPYSFAWSNGATSATLSGLCAGNYSVTISDINNCIEDTLFNIIEPTALSVNTTSEQLLCFDNCDGKATVFAGGGNQPYVFLWSNGSSSDSLFGLCPGQYIVTITDSNNCKLTDTVIIYTPPFNPAGIFITIGNDSILKGQSTTITINPSNGNIIWSPTTGITGTGSVINASPQITTTYTVSISDPNNPDCKIDTTIIIYVYESVCGEPDIYVPNAFTPNGDNQNDKVFVRGNNITELYFTIYNRWGEMVFETRNQSEGWDGTYNNMKADPGVFVYYLKATCPGHEEYFKKGNITLIR
jgi:gliding motility-associated-like protein